MSDELIQRAAKLMREQAAAYRQLDAACAQLGAALVRGEPSVVESLTRAGESELLRMRARLVEVMSALTAFADARASAPAESSSIGAEARAMFESASGEMLRAARSFQRTHESASALATSGATFTAACIETCGIQPTTYRAPYARRGEAQTWA